MFDIYGSRLFCAIFWIGLRKWFFFLKSIIRCFCTFRLLISLPFFRSWLNTVCVGLNEGTFGCSTWRDKRWPGEENIKGKRSCYSYYFNRPLKQRVIWNILEVSTMNFISLQESGMTIITAEDLDDAAEKAVKAASSWKCALVSIFWLLVLLFSLKKSFPVSSSTVEKTCI